MLGNTGKHTRRWFLGKAKKANLERGIDGDWSIMEIWVHILALLFLSLETQFISSLQIFMFSYVKWT